MAVNQYNTMVHNLGPHPRKGLLNKLNRKHAEKIYVDKKDGRTMHVGYVIGNDWWRIYEIVPWEKPA